MKYLLALHRGLNLTFPRFQKLKTHFDSDFKKAFNAKISDFQAANIDAKGIQKFFVNRDTISPEKEYEQLEKIGAKILLYDDENFPLSLQHINTPPAILFVRGRFSEHDFPSISVVGSRKISSYGKRALSFILNPIVEQKITIVSGLAFGADVLAHKTALDQKCKTIAVLGNGIDQIYPTQNKAIGERILKENLGAIISEYLPGTTVRPENFPIRNRIVAGLSKASIIIEAAEKSGTLITAHLANEMGRSVYAIPGEIFSKNNKGANQLISDGLANPALSGKQILSDLGFKSLEQKRIATQNIPKTGIEADILKTFENIDKMHIDEIFRNCALANPVISSNILILEIKGFLKNIGNQIYVKNF